MSSIDNISARSESMPSSNCPKTSVSHSASSAVRLSAMPNACAWAGSRSVMVTLISSHPNSRAASSVPFPAMTTPRESTTIGFCCPNTSSESRIALMFRGECLRAFAGSFLSSAILRLSIFKTLSFRPTVRRLAAYQDG